MITQLENALNNKENAELRKNLQELKITELNDQQFGEILSLLQRTTLSDAISNLNVSDNQLTALPPQIGQLTALQELDVSCNQLTVLPPQIGQLTALQELDVTDNRLTALPPEIGQLTALQMLDVTENQLTALPLTLGNCIALAFFDADNNPLQASSPRTIDALTQAWSLLQTAYRRSSQRKDIFLYFKNKSLLPQVHLDLQNQITNFTNDLALSALSPQELRILEESVNPEAKARNKLNDAQAATLKALFQAIEHNSDKSLKQFEELLSSSENTSIDLNARVKVEHNDTMNTLLHAATLNNASIEFTKLLLQHGANPNQTDSREWTPLTRALVEGRHDILAAYQIFTAQVNNSTWEQAARMYVGINDTETLDNQDSTTDKKELKNILDTELAIRKIKLSSDSEAVEGNNVQLVVEEPTVVLIHTCMQTHSSDVETGAKDKAKKTKPT